MPIGIEPKGFTNTNAIDAMVLDRTKDSLVWQLIRGTYPYSRGQRHEGLPIGCYVVGPIPDHGFGERFLSDISSDAAVDDFLKCASVTGARSAAYCHAKTTESFTGWKHLIDQMVVLRNAKRLWPVTLSGLHSAIQLPMTEPVEYGIHSNFGDWTDVWTDTGYSDEYWEFNPGYVSLTEETPKRLQAIRGAWSMYVKGPVLPGITYGLVFNAQGWDTNEDAAASCTAIISISTTGHDGVSATRWTYNRTFTATDTRYVIPITMPAFATTNAHRLRVKFEVSGSQPPNDTNPNLVLRCDKFALCQLGG